MKIEPNRVYRTRDGRKVRIYAVDGSPDYPIPEQDIEIEVEE